MTTPTPRWTAETEELVAQTIADHRAKRRGTLAYEECTCGLCIEYAGRTVGRVLQLHGEHRAAAVLTALADAGVLIPVGGETRHTIGRGVMNSGYERWSTTFPDGSQFIGPWRRRREVTDDPA